VLISVQTKLILAALAVTTYAEAQEPRFERGRVETTRAEFEARAAQQFAAIDADGSGGVDNAEYVAFQSATFVRADTNADGFVARGEARGFEPISPRTGESRDGKVSKEEYLAAAARRFANFDANNDGAIERDEYVAARLANFSKADRNGDGRLTVRELRGLEPA
jgi:Ca2+-binding EF-hand superfamily protein